MSTSPTTTTQSATPAAPAQRAAALGQPDAGERSSGEVSPASPLTDEYGRTSVADVVVRKIAGIATREVPGVHELGTSGRPAVGAVRQRIPGSTGPSAAQGVAVEVGEREAAVDVDVVVDFGASIVRVSSEIRTNIIRTVERLTGLRVIEVNVSVDDVYVASEDGEQSSRVE